MKPWSIFLAVFALVFVSRLPFLGAGYGWDSDAWRLAADARAIAETGRYAASRFPGYPVPELGLSLLWRAGLGGPWFLNGTSALMAALGAGLFALVLRRLGARDAVFAAPDAVLGALALASTPALYVMSTSSLDYAWAFGASLAALYFSLERRALPAALCLGLAIGCRIPTLAMVAPCGFLLAAPESPGAPARGDRRLLAFLGLTLIVGAACYLPALQASGTGFLRYYDHGYPSATLVVKKATLDLFGALGSAAVAGGALVALAGAVGRRRAPSRTRAAALPWAGPGIALGLLATLLPFLSLPYKAAYAIPVLPFVVILLARGLTPRFFRIFCVALLVSPWVLHFHETGKIDDPPPSRPHLVIDRGGHRFVVDLLRGSVPADYGRRLADMRYVGNAIARARALPGESVVVATDWLAQIRLRLGGDALGGTHFVYLLSRGELESLRRRGVPVYYLAGGDDENRQWQGVGLREFGARPLDERTGS